MRLIRWKKAKLQAEARFRVILAVLRQSPRPQAIVLTCLRRESDRFRNPLSVHALQNPLELRSGHDDSAGACGRTG
jgi:hypothetical protein